MLFWLPNEVMDFLQGKRVEGLITRCWKDLQPCFWGIFVLDAQRRLGFGNKWCSLDEVLQLFFFFCNYSLGGSSSFARRFRLKTRGSSFTISFHLLLWRLLTGWLIEWRTTSYSRFCLCGSKGGSGDNGLVFCGWNLFILQTKFWNFI